MSNSFQINDTKNTYYILRDDYLGEILIPAFHNSESVKGRFGYFSSAMFAEIAPGLATFLNNATGNIKLIIGPDVTPADHDAMLEAMDDTQIADLFDDLFITDDQIVNHTLKVFAWMIAESRLEIKIAFLKRGGKFHTKEWIFRNHNDRFLAMGSANATRAAITQNDESVAIHTSWKDTQSIDAVDRAENIFDEYWDDNTDHAVTFDLPEALKKKLFKYYDESEKPTESDLVRIQEEIKSDLELPESEISEGFETKGFSIPDYLEYDSGPFVHQGKAVKAWEDNNRLGIFDMATGSGKTITAMIATYNLYKKENPLFVFVSAPWKPLINQWCDEIKEFNLVPYNFGLMNPNKKKEAITEIEMKLKYSSDIEIIVDTPYILKDKEFQELFKQIKCKKMLIGDEVHNLGAEGFMGNPPDFFDYRLGLSATPERQYDDEGTANSFLKDFFGPIVFRYTLKEAIAGGSLVPYDYYVHKVELTEIEMDEWHDLNEQIKKMSFIKDKDPDTKARIQRRQEDKRFILENAQVKLDILKTDLEKQNISDLEYLIIYCSDKGTNEKINIPNRQIGEVNKILKELDVIYSQFTSKESSNRKEAKKILESFASSSIKCLTAMNVLDEGLNIPAIKKAYILASNTVEKQWIQRRGRVLRKSKNPPKSSAEIHDFVVLPVGGFHSDKDEKKLIENELVRIKEFADSSRNWSHIGGPLDVIAEIELKLYS